MLARHRRSRQKQKSNAFVEKPGRIAFVGALGRPTQGQVLFYFGDRTVQFRDVFGDFGFIR